MHIHTSGEIRFLQSKHFDKTIRHAIFTRQGGVSPDPWAELNLGSTVGDDPLRVQKNHQLALAAVGCNPASIFDVWQVHGINVVVAESPRSITSPHLEADAILTNKPGITLMMRFADCVPILLHDPVRKVVGIAHAGWMGTVKGTVRQAVEAMQSQFGSIPAEILAMIGPSIGPDHYEVGPDVAHQVKESFGRNSIKLLSAIADRITFDLWEANRLLLEQAGVVQIEIAGVCTACHIRDWYSHRAEKGCTGRFGAIMALV
jgi:YfiH family protein